MAFIVAAVSQSSPDLSSSSLGYLRVQHTSAVPEPPLFWLPSRRQIKVTVGQLQGKAAVDHDSRMDLTHTSDLGLPRSRGGAFCLCLHRHRRGPTNKATQGHLGFVWGWGCVIRAQLPTTGRGGGGAGRSSTSSASRGLGKYIIGTGERLGGNKGSGIIGRWRFPSGLADIREHVGGIFG